MKVKDFIKYEFDVDVYDDVCEECAIAFCGPLIMTNRGYNRWSDVLDFDIEVLDNNVTAIVHCEDEKQARRAAAFFNSAAGYCSVSNYEAWFDEGR